MWRHLASILLIIPFLACSGGGSSGGGRGGGGDDIVVALPPPVPVPPIRIVATKPVAPFPQAQSFSDTSPAQIMMDDLLPEYQNQNGLAAINANWAYARGRNNSSFGFGSATGEGVVIGVWDEGFDHTIPDFAGRVHPDSIISYSKPGLFSIDLDSAFPNQGQINVPETEAITRYPVAFCENRNDPLLGCDDLDRFGVLIPGTLITSGSRLFFTDQNGRDRRLPTTGYILANGDVVQGETFHGTFVASIAAAARGNDDIVQSASNQGPIHGVAFNAQLRLRTLPDSPYVRPPSFPRAPYMPIDISNPSEWRGIDNLFEDGIVFHNAGAEVVNISFGYSGGIELYSEALLRAAFPKTIRAFAQANVAAAERTIYVFSAGNAHGRSLSDDTLVLSPSPEIIAGMPARIAELRGHMLAIVSVNVSDDGVAGAISSFSNRCGIMRQWCLAAPGENVRGLTPTLYDASDQATLGSYISQGTSFAAPHVTGALAVLIDFFNGQIGNDEIVSRLLATANKQNIYNDAAIYGQGLLDLKAATEPFGEARLVMGPSLTAAAVAESETFLYHTGAFGDALNFDGAWLTVFDALDAPFPRYISHFVRQRVRASERARVPLGERLLPFKARDPLAAIAFNENSFFSETNFYQQDWFLGYHLHPAHGVSGGLDFSPSRHDEFFAPWLGFAKNGFSLGTRVNMGGMPLTMIGFIDMAEINPQNIDEISDMQGFLLNFAPHPSFTVQAGLLSEQNGLMGGLASGAFSIHDAQTWFVGSQQQFALGAWRVVASAYVGITQAAAQKNALLTPMGNIYSTSFSVGVVRPDLFVSGDRVRFFFTQPLRVEEAKARLRFVQGRTRYRELLRKVQTVNLKPSGRTMDVEASYSYPLNARFNLSVAANMIYQPNHDARAPTDMRLTARCFSYF